MEGIVNVVAGVVGGVVGVIIMLWAARRPPFMSVKKVRPNWRFRLVSVLAIGLSLCFVAVGSLSVIRGNVGGIFGIFVGGLGGGYFAYKGFFHYIIIKGDSFVEKRFWSEREVPFESVEGVEYVELHDVYKIDVSEQKPIVFDRSMEGASYLLDLLERSRES